ncbi:hypothetical protein PG994_009373 [Apiospora phragmitis]|uniref:Acyl-CoA thioesterase II n=1 Tax=Apiospora phragmitis TaxID=2905665 RepID=A0ABR1ULG8_9PEZI
MASTTTEQTAIEEIGPGQFRSKVNPGRMGNSKPIAYGGCTLGVATRAAYTTVSPNHRLYSLVGHYLGPASTTERLVCIVHDTRTTKSFTTRRVVVQQAQPTTTGGEEPQQTQMRTCMELIADFHAEEPAAPGKTYSAAPSHAYAGPSDQSETPVVLTSVLTAAETAAAARSRDVFALHERFFESRPCREGVAAQNLNGMLKARPTTQDALPLADRTSAEWMRNKTSLETPADQAAALAFCLDGGLAFLPLTLDRGWLDDVDACSSLDFALRFMTPHPDFNRWHLRERKTIAGGAGRTYSEGRLWDQDGNLVAVMSQQSIMRPKPEKTENKEKASRL